MVKNASSEIISTQSANVTPRLKADTRLSAILVGFVIVMHRSTVD